MEMKRPTFLDKPVFSFLPNLNWEAFLAILIIILALFSRLYMVDVRVMSHDEVNHVVPAYDFYQGRGYSHDPITHGPLQFHLLAASYFIFGDSDFSARVPAALFSIAAIVFLLFAMRRYLGRIGALLAGFFTLISPYLLYYGRYTRNEGLIELFAVVTLYAVLRYLDRKDKTSMILLTIITALHFTTKETSYIYTAQLLIFLAILLFIRLVNSKFWKSDDSRRNFTVFSILTILLFIISFGITIWSASATEVNEAGNAIESINTTQNHQTLLFIFIAAFVVAAVGDLIYLIKNLGWKAVRSEPSFDLLMLLGTLVLPTLVAFPVRLLGWDPLDYTQAGYIRTGGMVLLMVGISALIGFWWNRKKWALNMVLFYTIFIIFYTTFFTNGRGFFTGLVGSLGYWMLQQSVERGTQPLYYYALIQMPIYEYLSIAGAFLATYLGIRYKRFETLPGCSPADVQTLSEPDKPLCEESVSLKPHKVPTLALLLFWSVVSLVVFSIAGERMPWLTVHIAIPFSLTSAWGVSFLLERIPWKKLLEKKPIVVLLLTSLFLSSIAGVFGILLGDTPPFQGKELFQLQSTSTFLLSMIFTLGTAYFLYKTLKDWKAVQIAQLLLVSFFLILTLLTIRTAYMASFINYDYATEFLVYAHASPAPKEILAQIEQLSYRITGGKDLDISYDNNSLYPYWWYFRDYSNANYFAEEPTRDIANSIVILASDEKYGKIDSIVKDNYVHFDYIRLWWPMQDYFNLTFENVLSALSNPDMRAALFQIWLNRDYSKYAEVKGSSSLTTETWSPADLFRMYIRKDVVAQIWEYGVVPEFEVLIEEDPYLLNTIDLLPDRVIGGQGSDPGLFNSPRGLAVAEDGSIYVADSMNHRIQHFSPTGDLISSWGSFADDSLEPADGGTFNEPWDVAVGPEGNVYVADTWNHRIQKFTPEGDFIAMWGAFGTGETTSAMWGPRSIVVDPDGLVYVTDTGNKRVVIFTSDGEAYGTFGSVGFDPGQFDEPVGIALDTENNIFVADTWNRRLQSISNDKENHSYLPLQLWDVYAWYSQSLDNKPYIAIDENDNLFVTDPEGYRIIQFDLTGNYIRSWGDYSSGSDGFGLPSGITADGFGGVWVSDAGNHKLLHFTLPSE
ncbi:MAG: glycosyltransferase family 39 protein [Anaerolineaceae bacterium]|nr:glycosyltransferase family 39 protein [Anaerolineaceae bacterium]